MKKTKCLSDLREDRTTAIIVAKILRQNKHNNICMDRNEIAEACQKGGGDPKRVITVLSAFELEKWARIEPIPPAPPQKGKFAFVWIKKEAGIVLGNYPNDQCPDCEGHGWEILNTEPENLGIIQENLRCLSCGQEAITLRCVRKA
jgi:hypothetical protein